VRVWRLLRHEQGFGVAMATQERCADVTQVEALVSHIVGAELDGGPAALLRGWAGLSRNALDAVAEQQGGKAAGNAVLIFMTGAEEINRTVRPPRR